MTPVSYGTLTAWVKPDGTFAPGEDHPNAHLILSRLWLGTRHQGALSDDDRQLEHLRTVAAAAGQVKFDLLAALAARRRAFAESLRRREPELAVRHLRITPRWRVVVGHGEHSVHETSLTFSPTYGVPIWPASTLKGLAAAQARARWRDRPHRADIVARIFGAPRPDDRERTAHQGTVTIMDAFPVTPPRLVVDVLTPHVGPYYQQVNTSSEQRQVTIPPAEYHNPVPVHFLAVEETPFHTTLIGDPTAVAAATELLTDAVDDLGIGAKTAAGYGYCTVEEVP